jgi:hypothetical protein
MNFQEKVAETTADFRAKAAKRVETLKGSLAALKVAGTELNKVARRHVSRFVKENSAIATEAGKEVGALARATYAQLANKPSVTPRKTRKPAARKRATAKAA